MPDLNINNIQEVVLLASFQDAAGNPVAIDGSPQWLSEDPLIGSITPDATDPFKAIFSTTGTLGTTRVVVSGDARIGPQEVLITGAFEIEVTASEAVVVNVEVLEIRPRSS